MKQFFLHWMARWKFVILPALIKLGFWGTFAVALLDSSSIPVPLDAIIAVFVWNNKTHFLLYCAMAAAGSALGGLVPYGIGRAGGELFLLKRINRERFEQLRDRFEGQEFLAVAIPSMLPPPTPWKLFVFAAGVFEMRVVPFLIAVFVGRMIRWITLSLLVLKLGPSAVDLVAHHALKALAVAVALAFIAFLVWWLRRKKAGAPGPGL